MYIPTSLYPTSPTLELRAMTTIHTASALPTATPTAATSPQDAFRAQYTRPGDVMSVLLLLGGDVIQRALAQLSGGPITPVAFSFGWVTYAISALLAAVGVNKLLPQPDATGYVVNSRSRYSRQNNSWILGRIIRDYEWWCNPRIVEAGKRLITTETERRLTLPAEEQAKYKHPPRVALSIAVYEASKPKTDRNGTPVSKIVGTPDNDWVYYTGVLCAVVQLGIAAIPWALWGDWSILLTTACGIVLAFASGALPQWKAEKWACRRGSTKTVSLTAGNGTKHVFVVLGGGVGLDLEDLAGGRGVDKPETRALTAVLAVLWVALLIAVSGLKQNPWFLLAVGIIGMIQNVIVCAAPRRPGAFGIHLEFKEVIVHEKVMKALMAAEERYPYVGRSLVDTFFPGSILRPDEEEWWKEAEVAARAADDQRKRQA